jgi:hypothetical protein
MITQKLAKPMYDTTKQTRKIAMTSPYSRVRFFVSKFAALCDAGARFIIRAVQGTCPYAYFGPAEI